MNEKARDFADYMDYMQTNLHMDLPDKQAEDIYDKVEETLTGPTG